MGGAGRHLTSARLRTENAAVYVHWCTSKTRRTRDLNGKYYIEYTVINGHQCGLPGSTCVAQPAWSHSSLCICFISSKTVNYYKIPKTANIVLNVYCAAVVLYKKNKRIPLAFLNMFAPVSNFIGEEKQAHWIFVLMVTSVKKSSR